MFDKRYAIKNVKIGSFVNNKTGQHIVTDSDGKSKIFEYIEVNADSIDEILAIIDEKNNNAIDIFNGNIYHILKRDEHNRIIEKTDFVQTDVLYALNINNDKKFTDSQLFKIYCNSIAIKVASDYEQKYEGNVSFQKVKRK